MNINVVKIQLYSRRYLSDVFFSFRMICCEVLVRSMKDSWQKFEGNYSSTSSSLVDKVPGLFIHKWLDQPLWEEWSSKLALLINLCTVYSFNIFMKKLNSFWKLKWEIYNNMIYTIHRYLIQWQVCWKWRLQCIPHSFPNMVDEEERLCNNVTANLVILGLLKYLK